MKTVSSEDFDRWYRLEVLTFALLVAMAIFAIASCGTVTPTPTPDPKPVSYVEVCAHLADIGCPEGALPNCATALQRAEDDRLTDLRPQCLLDASTIKQARACGSITCP
jgi:hypothetical protein